MAIGLSPALERVIAAAGEHAATRRHRHIQLEHLLRAIVGDAEACAVLKACGADLAELIRELDDYLDLVEPAQGAPRPQVDAACNQVLLGAALLSQAAGREATGVLDVLDRLLGATETYAALLLRAAGPAGIERADLRRAISHGDVRSPAPAARALRVRVRLHNDPYTAMEFVVAVLVELFGLPPKQARERMLEIHTGDSALIADLPAADAIDRADELTRRAQAEGFPLRCTLEPLAAPLV